MHFVSAVAFAISMFWGVVAMGEDRNVALVIGNSGYQSVARLNNPANDAKDIAAALVRLGFAVELSIDANDRQMRQLFQNFASMAETADLSLVYFAGHGIEVDKSNYLIPVNAELATELDVEFETVPLDLVMRSLVAAEGVKIVLIDACRNNPFATRLNEDGGSRSIGKGLVRVDPIGGVLPGGILVGYAAREGTHALDGYGRNSPYAQALLEHLEEPGLEISKLFRKVRDRVFELTKGVQEPFTYGALPSGDIFLSPAPDNQWPSAGAKVRPYSGNEIGPPKWCSSTQNETQEVICNSNGLLNLDKSLEEDLGRYLEPLAGGRRGEALVEQREWRLARDSCGRDEACIRRAYNLRLLSLAGGEAQFDSPALIVQAVQNQLNRLSCGAGEADGTPGRRTMGAITRLKRLGYLGEASAEPQDREMLHALHEIPTGVCSTLFQAADNKSLLLGNWSLSAACGADSGFPNSAVNYSMRLASVTPVGLSGSLRRYPNNNTGVLVATIQPGGFLDASIVWPSGARSSLSLKPDDTPDGAVGVDFYRCKLNAQKQ